MAAKSISLESLSKAELIALARRSFVSEADLWFARCDVLDAEADALSAAYMAATKALTPLQTAYYVARVDGGRAYEKAKRELDAAERAANTLWSRLETIWRKRDAAWAQVERIADARRGAAAAVQEEAVDAG